MKALALLFTMLLPLFAQDDIDPFSLPFAQEKIETKASLIAEVSTVAPGEDFTIALKLEHPDGWHSYYKNPGLLGEVLEMDWNLPEGVEVTYQGWPTPHYSIMLGYNTIGYEGTVYHLYKVSSPANLAPGSEITLSADASWQICDEDNCIGENGSVSLTLPVAQASSINEATAPEFASARAHMPQPAGDLEITVTEAAGTITVNIPASSGLQTEGLTFFDEDGQVDSQAAHTASQDGDTIILKVPRNPGNDFQDAPEPLDHVKGIISDGETAIQFRSPIEVAKTPVNLSTILPVFIGMFFGGLILNLMPCVFPVIGLKIMGFVEQAGHDRKKVMVHGLAFAGGVLASFWILVAIMIAGGIKNWGGQLTNPWVMFILIVVMLLLALNMYGVFEIGTSATGVGSNLTKKTGLSGSFFSGILATVVATPCSAPFLGSALGVAVTLPTFWFFLAFTVMAIGLSLPYVILSAFPDLVKMLPKPGAWMESFKQGMSFLLFATVGYLLWVYSGQVFEQDAGQKGLMVMIGLSIIAAAAWVWGRWNVPYRKPKVRYIASGVTLLLLGVGIAFAKPSSSNEKVPEWEKWTKAKEQEYLEEGRPVYVDFTAKWCLTCQSNKKVAYSEEVIDFFEKANGVFLKADKTNPNEEIDREVRALGKTAIPVNVLRLPEEPAKPHITKEILTAGYLLDFMKDRIKVVEDGSGDA
ncbi:MAG: protein-disulfide reductase DsbD family protein [Verrucomicrobiota bacterium JB023]|nr:protein-disulfide reductase DsbD family protein [Verrucomicrobiota bacterium JB023]